MKVWKTGDVLAPAVFEPITRDELVKYAEASQDHNPIHLDEAFAKAAGFPTVIVHGMLVMAFAGDYIWQNFSEKDYRLLRFRTRFKKVTFPGDVLTAEGKVRAIQDGGGLVLQLALKNQRGETPLDGEATLIPV